LVFLVAVVSVIAAAAIGAAGFYLYRQDRIFPPVHTLGLKLGGMTVAEAKDALAQRWTEQEIVVRSEDGASVAVPAPSLGIILDATATAERAHRQGRVFDGLQEAVAAALGPDGFPAIWYFDANLASATLRTIAPQFEVTPVNARIVVENGKLHALPGIAGRELAVGASVGALQQQAAQVLAEGEALLLMETISPPLSDLSGAVASLNDQLDQMIELQAYDPVRDETVIAQIAPETWVEWLAFAANPDDGTISWHVEPAAVTAFLEEEGNTFGDDRYVDTGEGTTRLVAAIEAGNRVVALRLYHYPRQHVVQAGETFSTLAYDYGIPYPWIQQANPAVDENLFPGQTITIPSPDVLLPLPVVPNKRIVVSLGQQRLWAYEAGALRWEWPVSTGIESSPTAPGIFQVQSHEQNAYASVWDLWMPQFMGIYRPVPTSDFMNGFHGFPTRNGYNLLWTNSLGRPVTYGCILVSNENIAQLYEWAEEGVIVEVTR
jgi:lipoprotein-anchoring transpeptidase ErfK/SrfK